MKKINICFHIDNISNCGGTEKVTTQISNLLLEHFEQYNISIISSYYEKEKGPFFEGNCNIRYDSLFDKPVHYKIKYFQFIKRLKKYIIQNQIDILIGVDTIMSLFDLPAIRKTKCKYIAWEHFNYHYNLGVKLRDYGRKLSVKKADAVVVLTNKDLHYFKKNLNIKSKLIKIYNPFMSEKQNSDYDDRSNIILSSGRLTYQKGFDILIEVATSVKQKHENFKWIILGEGEDRPILEKKVQEYGLDSCVKFIGNVKNVGDYYKQASMFVLTSRFEGLGLVMLEAKSFHLPIVSFDCDCGPSEMIQEQVNGYLIEPYDIEQMSHDIYKLLSHKNLRTQFSNNAKLDMEKFYPDVIIKEWDKLFKDVLK